MWHKLCPEVVTKLLFTDNIFQLYDASDVIYIKWSNRIYLNLEQVLSLIREDSSFTRKP